VGEEGDSVADSVDFEAFCLQHNSALIRMLTLYCGDREVARDLTQEALTRAWVHWRKVRKMDRGDLWLRRVAVNLANSHFRHVLVERSAGPVAGATTWSEGPDVASGLVMRAALAQLTPRQREAVVLRFMDDLSVVQTADVMGCGPGTVKKLTARALVSLREQVGVDIEVGQDA
jgi:RNA polymerase sigma-70 factor (sigma-E family)